MRRHVAAAILLLASLLLPAAALGHAELVSSDPADGASVQGSGPFTLVFSEPLAEGSKAELSADTGGFGPVEAGPDAADPTRIVLGEFEVVLPADTYTIEWTSVADDGDILRGTIHFTITAPPPTDTPAPSVEPSITPAPSPSASPSPSPAPAPSAEPRDGSGDNSGAIVPIIVGLAFVGLLATWLIRRSRAT